MVIKPAQDDLLCIGLVVAVCVGVQHQVGALRYINALRRQLKADREVQLVGKDRLLVGLAIVVGVFQDDDLVVWLRITRFPVRVRWHGGHPKAPFVIEGQLNGVRQIFKLPL